MSLEPSGDVTRLFRRGSSARSPMSGSAGRSPRYSASSSRDRPRGATPVVHPSRGFGKLRRGPASWIRPGVLIIDAGWSCRSSPAMRTGCAPVRARWGKAGSGSRGSGVRTAPPPDSRPGSHGGRPRIPDRGCRIRNIRCRASPERSRLSAPRSRRPDPRQPHQSGPMRRQNSPNTATGIHCAPPRSHCRGLARRRVLDSNPRWLSWCTFQGLMAQPLAAPRRCTGSTGAM